MRLHRQHLERGIPAVRVLQPEQRSREGEPFDPRLDLPSGENQRLIAWLRKPEGTLSRHEERKLEALLWLTTFDPQYAEYFRHTPLFEGRLAMDEASAKKLFLPTSSVDRTDLIALNTYELTRRIQVAPEGRNAFLAVTHMQWLYEKLRERIDRMESLDDTWQRMREIVRMVQVWPNKQEELLEHFFPGERQEADVLEALERADSSWLRITYGADVVLLFPQYKDKVLRRLQDDLKQAQAEIAKMQKTERSVTGFEVLQSWLAAITILQAEQAVITSEGKIQVKLTPLDLKTQARLPERLDI